MKKVFMLFAILLICISSVIAEEYPISSPKGEDMGSETGGEIETKNIVVPQEMVEKQQKYLIEWRNKIENEWKDLSEDEREKKRTELKEKILGE